ncbi:uncharacterized protein QC763_0044590 [Podospora pseudopauciseta]|uniref:ribonuclease T1 n=1 Tax=Podospora pseudopauciseta TaxID=2093780 RepID=A0ABR0HRR2_9PEZI|nr:hypothetical protein QC763_0044590 [Podospora pseudopauciseta]
MSPAPLPWDTLCSMTLAMSLNRVYTGYYPHQFKNLEAFDFVTEPPYFEYPIMPGDIYTSGPPGPDRVIFDDDGVVEGLITHSGASKDGFMACKEKTMSA